MHDAGHPQHPQVLRDQGLRRAEDVDELVYASDTAARQLGDDRDPQRRRQRAQQLAGGGEALVLGDVHRGQR